MAIGHVAWTFYKKNLTAIFIGKYLFLSFIIRLDYYGKNNPWVLKSDLKKFKNLPIAMVSGVSDMLRPACICLFIPSHNFVKRVN